MRGLARHGRSPDGQSRRGWSRCAARLFSQVDSSLHLSLAARFPPRFRSLGPPSRLSPRLRIFPTSCLRPLCAFSLPARLTKVVCSRAVRLEVALPCTWIPIYVQIPASSWPRKYLDARVSRILFLRGKPRHRGMFPKRKGHKHTGISHRFPLSSCFTRN